MEQYNISTLICDLISRNLETSLQVEMSQFTRIPITRLNVSFMLLNYSQCIRLEKHTCIQNHRYQASN